VVDPEALREGVVMVLRGLEGLLGRHGLGRIPTGPGQAFDPQLHEAVLVEPASEGVPRGAIVREISPGFQAASGRVVRPARVSVAGPATT
jgi:molecular chaperone GrpE